MKILALASLERTISQQHSRLLWLSEGDANTEFFHLQACHRRKKNHIHSLCHKDMVVAQEEVKEDLIFRFFDDILGRSKDRTVFLNYDALHIPALDLSSLNGPFTEAEVRKIVNDLPNDKAPRPDGFTALFYKRAWHIIKHDILRAINALVAANNKEFHLVNNAYIVLLPKKSDAAGLLDYRPISLIHSFSKLVAKAFSVRLTPFLPSLVGINQSAFVRGRQIHDNFRYVQQAAKLLHTKRQPRLLLKVDIARAFDSVSWAFLLELLQHMGFSRSWINCIATLLSTASTKVLLNDEPGRRICHGRGLRQGDPLSPMLFLLVMECLNKLIQCADDTGTFQDLGCRAIKHRASFYADDMIMFLSPTTSDLQVVKSILQTFEAATGLSTNMAKCDIAPIRCTDDDVLLVQQEFPCQITAFPLKYLGIPLSVTKLERAAIQPLVDAVADHLPTWKARLLSSGGRLILTKVTLSAIPTYMSIALVLPPWALKAIDKLRRALLWTGSEAVSGGKCLVAWTRVTRPQLYGGLGVIDLRLFGFAVRSKWHWRDVG